MESIVQRDSLDEYTQKVSAKYKNMFAPKSAVGAPLSASTAAAMTDTSKIYVYTGSQSGYTAGNWYYYDGSTWISGGVYNSTAFEADTTLSISGAAADAKAVGDAIDLLQNKGLTYLGTFLNSETWDTVTTDGTKSFDGLPNNIFAVCNTTETSNVIDNAPVSGLMTGRILTFGRGTKTSRLNYDTQIFIPQSMDKIQIRKYYDGSWSNWTAVGGTYIEDEIAALPQYRPNINADFESYNFLISNVTDDGTFHVSQTYSGSGAIVQRWSDLPDLENNFIITNTRYSTNWILQTALSTTTYVDIYRRIIPVPGTGGTAGEWVKADGIDPRLKVLAIGDSICAGARNNGKGFVGDLGLPYKNAGVSGAALSTVRSPDVEDIPSRFIRFFEYHSQDVNASNDGWEPDIIIANGGHNDYGQNAPLGIVPTAPAINDDGSPNYNTLNTSTVMGGLQKLFLLMVEKYPKAQRFFITTHKIYRNAQTETNKNGYLPSKNNDQGYNETELHDAIVTCCKIYNVEVIDIFNNSLINSAFAGYRGNTYYKENISGAAADMRNYFDKDGVHPLNRGYLEGYIPLIRSSIATGTVKS